jgi:hypothetical protein
MISFVTRVEKEICASAKAAIVDPAACSALLKSSSCAIALRTPYLLAIFLVSDIVCAAIAFLF